MTVETLRHFFGWCAVINYALLLLWFALHLAAHSFFAGLGQRFFNMSPENYDSMAIKGMMYLKLSIWLFNIGPYLALWIVK